MTDTNPFLMPLAEIARAGEYIVGDVIGGIGGPAFDNDFVANIHFKPNTLVARSTVVGATNGLLVPWDPASADAGTKALFGIFYYGFRPGAAAGPSVPAMIHTRGTFQKIRTYEGRLVYPSTVAYADMVAAVKALGFTVSEIAPPPFSL